MANIYLGACALDRAHFDPINAVALDREQGALDNRPHLEDVQIDTPHIDQHIGGEIERRF